ncbi:MAG: hypothetical protein CM1200mP14_26750 [Gammaproteobacteria bacterium]|nr:MAG: hypothetical protein CM1200mP14_26750 [Gammaproteobacteria bacterium]
MDPPILEDFDYDFETLMNDDVRQEGLSESST